MVKITSLFNKSHAYLLFFFGLGISAHAQCPANITVNNTPGTCGAAVTYNVTPTGPGTVPSANGVVNGSAGNGFGGWTVNNGGSGWIENGAYFLSSYIVGTMTQVIDLTNMGMTDAYMDTQPAITVSEEYVGWQFNWADTYSLTVQLRGENDNIIATYATGNIICSTVQQTASNVFTGYGAGVRKVYISHTGKDAEYWSGQYGAAVTNVQCTVAVPGGTVAQTAGIASGSVFPIGTTTNTFTLTGTDNVVSTCSFDVTVTDNQAPTITLNGGVTAALDENGEATVALDDINITAVDNCTANAVTFTMEAPAYTCENLGLNALTVTATDGTNTATQLVYVTVVDSTPPVIAEDDYFLVIGEDGTAVLGENEGELIASDNCSMATVTYSQTEFTCDSTPTTVTVTATDAAGNVSTGEIIITVTDDIDPVAVAQNINIELTEDGWVTLDAAALGAGSTDNCSIVEWAVDITSFECDDIGENTVTLTVTDAAGHTATTTAVVTVTDPNNYCVVNATAANFANAVTLYPNPATSVLTIAANGYSITKVALYDLNGRQVQDIEGAANGLLTADVSGLSAGIYMVKLYTADGGVAIKKLVKE